MDSKNTKIKGEIPYYYLFIYSKLKERAWNSSVLDTPVVIQTFKNSSKMIPRVLIFHILDQMEKYGLIQRINRLRYKVIQNDALTMPIEQKMSRHYKDDTQFGQVIEEINKDKKICCEDASVYRILPNSAVKKLNALNCWMIRAN